MEFYRIDCLCEYHADQCGLTEPMLGQPQLVFDGVGLEEGHAESNPIHHDRSQCDAGQEMASCVHIPAQNCCLWVI